MALTVEGYSDDPEAEQAMSNQTEETMVPVEVDAVRQAFPANIRDLMPSRTVIDSYESGWGSKLFNDWFFCGLKKLELAPKPGIDATKARRHIQTIMGSFEPKHEDKEAACAYLFELWFEPGKWERKELKL